MGACAGFDLTVCEPPSLFCRGLLPACIPHSSVWWIGPLLCSYFTSKNCMRELLTTYAQSKPAIALIDPEVTRGGLTLPEIRARLVEANDTLFEKWGLPHASDQGEALYDHLFAHSPIEWNRIGHFQDVTMRLIAERLLPAGAAGSTYVDNEVISRKRRPLPPPQRTFHVYCSELNPGAAALLDEVALALGMTLSREAQAYEHKHKHKHSGSNRSSLILSSARASRFIGSGRASTAASDEHDVLAVTDDFENLATCDHMLLYLTSQTWTRGAASDALADEIATAMDLGVHVLLAHEMIGIGGQEARFGCEFGSFFTCADGATPGHLLQRGIYTEVAVPLKGVPWRASSCAIFGLTLDASATQKGNDDDDLSNVNDARMPLLGQLLNACAAGKASLMAHLMVAFGESASGTQRTGSQDEEFEHQPPSSEKALYSSAPREAIEDADLSSSDGIVLDVSEAMSHPAPDEGDENGL